MHWFEWLQRNRRMFPFGASPNNGVDLVEKRNSSRYRFWRNVLSFPHTSSPPWICNKWHNPSGVSVKGPPTPPSSLFASPPRTMHPIIVAYLCVYRASKKRGCRNSPRLERETKEGPCAGRAGIIQRRGAGVERKLVVYTRRWYNGLCISGGHDCS